MNTSMPAAPAGRPLAHRAGAEANVSPAGDIRHAGFDFEQLLRERSTGRGKADGTRREPGSEAWNLREPDDSATDLRTLMGGHRFEGRGGGLQGLSRGRRNGADAGGEADADANADPADANHATQRVDLFVVPDTRFEATAVSTRPGARGDTPGSFDAARAALEAALTNPVLPLESDAAAKWEVTIPQALGPSLELRACRTQQTADVAAAWTLDIRSSREMSPVLARTASRLSDRLEARWLPSRIRIERSDEEDAQ